MTKRTSKAKASKAALAAKSEKNAEHTHKTASIVPLRWKLKYEQTDLPGSCGDKAAKAFAEAVTAEDGSMDLSALHAIGKANGIDCLGRWGARNPGQQRMNLGNVLRGMQRRGETVRIGDETFAGAKQPAKVAKPARKAAKAKAIKPAAQPAA